MNPGVNIGNLVRQLLPLHKRQPLRLAWLRALLSPLAALYQDFDKWRDDTRMMINVNSQVKVLEGYLRAKYNERIRIVTFADGLLFVGLKSEGSAMHPDFGLKTENVYKEIPLRGESRDRFGDADFIVYVPRTVDINLISAEIQKYKRALITYKIIQN